MELNKILDAEDLTVWSAGMILTRQGAGRETVEGLWGKTDKGKTA